MIFLEVPQSKFQQLKNSGAATVQFTGNNPPPLTTTTTPTTTTTTTTATTTTTDSVRHGNMHTVLIGLVLSCQTDTRWTTECIFAAD